MIGRLSVCVVVVLVGSVGCNFQPYLTDTLGLLPGPSSTLLNQSIYGTSSDSGLSVDPNTVTSTTTDTSLTSLTSLI